MSRELWPFYWKELNFLREQAKEFAKEYKEQAGFLGLDTTTGRSPDPHVERMIQAFALLAARVHQKIDDDFPELTEALLGLLYPHYLAPIPSMLIARLEPHSGADLTWMKWSHGATSVACEMVKLMGIVTVRDTGDFNSTDTVHVNPLWQFIHPLHRQTGQCGRNLDLRRLQPVGTRLDAPEF